MTAIEQVREVLQRFQDGYTARDVARLDAFMELINDSPDSEMIGIGAAERNGFEWFEGTAAIRSIIEGDWTYWGDVALDVQGAHITVHDKTAWFSTTGSVTQRDTFEESVPSYLEQMQELMNKEGVQPSKRLWEATYFGIRRLHEKMKGAGHSWPLVVTGVLVESNGTWRFHALHWSMPVE